MPVSPASAADARPATPAASSPASAVADRSVSDIVAQLAASESLQRSALDRLPLEQRWSDLSRRTEQAEAAFAVVLPSAQGGLAAANLVGLSHETWQLSNQADAIVRDLTDLARRLERELDALEHDAALWRDNLPILRRSQVPQPVLDGAQSIAQQVQDAAARVREARDRALLALVRAQSLQTEITAATSRIATGMEQILTRRSELDSLPIWHLDATHDAPGEHGLGADAGAASLRQYLAREGGRLGLLFAGVFALCWWLFTRPPVAGESPARRAYGSPIAASLLLALTALWWLAPDPPLRWYSVLLIALPLPVAAVGRRAFASAVPLTLYGMALATMLLGVGNMLVANPLAGRLLLLLQIACFAGALTVDLRRGRLAQAFARWSPENVRVAALVVIAASVLSALHAIFGLTGPPRTLRLGVTGLISFGLVFGSAAAVAYGAALSLLGTPLFGWVRSARNADPTLLRGLRFSLVVLAVIGTALATLGALALVPETLATLDAVSQSSVDIGTVTISTTALATALAVVLATWLFSGAVRFVLEREVFPRLQLRPGVGYAIATFTRWAIYIVGVMLTLAALGVDSTRITVLAGALGVGIGFGLQTVVNNFVSGIILIVERPVAVGDLVEIGPLLGEIQRIGIRSSSVRTTQGAEVIVPNSDFASKEVINWTRSDRQRRYDIDVGVAYGSDPTEVMRLLEEAAREVPEVMPYPAPMAMFHNFGDSSLDFRVLAWVRTIDLGLKAQTAIRVALLRKLDAAGIAIPFPQRDVYLHTVGDAAPAKPEG